MQSVHIVSAYDEELKFLSKRIAAMGGHAERMVEQAIAALVNADPGLAQKVIQDDLVLDEGQREIDDKAIIIIAKRVAAIIDGRQPNSLFRGLEALANLALTQLKEVLDVYASRSVEKIGFVRDRDDQIDAMYTSLFRELLTYMMEDPRNITPCTHLLFCAKNIERIGDRATNIAETIYYIVTGDQMPADRPKGDKTDQVVMPGTGIG